MKLHTAILAGATLLVACPDARAGDRNPIGNGDLPDGHAEG